MMSLALLLPAAPALAQDGSAPANQAQETQPATTPTTQLSIAADQDAFYVGQIVRLYVTNTGSLALEGRYIVAIHRVAECNGAEACAGLYSYQVRSYDREDRLAPGEARLYEWDGLTQDGVLAEPGEFYATVEFRSLDRVVGAESRHFDLVDEGPDDPLAIQILYPYEGAVVPAESGVAVAPVAVHVASNLALDSVSLYVDGILYNAFTGLSGSGDAYELRHELQVARGAHLLAVEAHSADAQQAWAWSNFNVGEPITPAILAVTTDRSSYGPGEQVVIQLYNSGPSEVTGYPDVGVVDQAGARVWTHLAVGASEQTLKPGEHRLYPWDQLGANGQRVAPGVYGAEVHWGGSAGAAKFEVAQLPPVVPFFDIAFVAPRPGDAVGDDVHLAIELGPPGAHEVEVTVTNGAGFESTLRHAFEAPSTGTLGLRQSLAGAPEGTYKAYAVARGPGGTADDITYFRLVRGEDETDPELVVVYPQEDQELPLRFPVAFRVTDDVGVVYAEVRIGDALLGRQSWDNPVMGGAVVAFVPEHLVGPQVLTLVVYDGGKHEVREEVPIVLREHASSCESALLTAKDQVEATYADGPESTAAPAEPSSASPETVVGFSCPGQTVAARPIEQGDYSYARTDDAFVDIQVKGVQVIDRLQQATPSRVAMPLSTLGKFLVVGAPEAGQLHFDLNGTWIATQRGSHVVLENTEEGSRVLLVFVGGSPSILGHRVETDLSRTGKVVVRPLTSELDDAVADAIIDGLVGAEVSVESNAPQAVSYSDLNVTVTTAANAVQAILSTPLHEGRTLVFSLGPGAPVTGDVEVLLDGLPLTRASRLEDVLDPHDDDGASEYYVVQADGETKVIVSIGHFSTRYLVIQAANAIEPFLTPLTILGGLGIVGAAALVLFRREDD